MLNVQCLGVAEYQPSAAQGKHTRRFHALAKLEKKNRDIICTLNFHAIICIRMSNKPQNNRRSAHDGVVGTVLFNKDITIAAAISPESVSKPSTVLERRCKFDVVKILSVCNEYRHGVAYDANVSILYSATSVNIAP